MGRLILLSALIFSGALHAGTISENFTSRADFDNGTAIWNQVLGAVHPTLEVINYESGSPPRPFAVGDGSDGPFDDTNYAQWSVGGDLSGNIIRLDTTAHPVLQVTHFILDQGWFVEPVGPNPLIIESLSFVQILGEIHCQGFDGQSSVGATIGAGGAGRCGGAAGGDGGGAGAAGSNGGNTGTSVTGGQGGNYTVVNYVGGGGGGSWSGAGNPQDGPNSSVLGGQAGLFFSEPEFLTIAGGAGGGGGSGDATTAGGGGGGGGGVVLISAVGNIDIGASPSSVYGYVLVNGGNGGSASATGGPGGGGGGGSVQLFSGNLVDLFNTDPAGASQANQGSGGTNSSAAIGASGSIGRSWLSTSNNFTGGTGVYSPLEEFPVSTGEPEFSQDTQYVITRSFDTGGNFATLGQLTLTPSSPDFVFEVEGSDDGFASDNTGWTTNPGAVSSKRYLKMKLSLNMSGPGDFTMLNSAALTFMPGSPSEYAFQSAGCGRVSGSPIGNFLLLLFGPLLLIALKIKAQRQLTR